MPGGRPSKYKPRYCKDILNYFNVAPYREIPITKTDKQGNSWVENVEKANDLPLFSGFASKIGVCTDTLLEWCSTHKDFSVSYKKAKAMQNNMLATNGLKGLYQGNFAIFAGKNLMGWRDKIETTTNSNQPILNLILDSRKALGQDIIDAEVIEPKQIEGNSD